MTEAFDKTEKKTTKVKKKSEEKTFVLCTQSSRGREGEASTTSKKRDPEKRRDEDIGDRDKKDGHLNTK